MKILTLETDESFGRLLARVLGEWGHEAVHDASAAAALKTLESFAADALLLDSRVGLDLCALLQVRHPRLKVLVMSDSASASLQALRAGAEDALLRPFELEELRLRLEKLAARLDQLAEVGNLRRLMDERYVSEYLFLGDPSMKAVYTQLQALAEQEHASVLLHGEAGTGKEHAARLVHAFSSRWNRPFVDLHCTAKSDLLLLNELFGDEAAIGKDRSGLVKQAQGGTLFLDEIGELSLTVQAQLQKALDDPRLDLRLIAATHRELEAAVASGSFRLDLYQRLSSYPVEMPALRSRLDDIGALAQFFFEDSCRNFRKRLKPMDEALLRAFQSYPWPGNIRELKNTVERMVIQCRDAQLTTASLPAELRVLQRPLVAAISPARAAAMAPERGGNKEALIIELERCRWNKSEVARRLGISRPTLLKRLREWEIN